MIGKNRLILNEATIIEALQDYLNKCMTSYAPKVLGIVLQNGYGDSFEVSVETVEDDFQKALKSAYITDIENSC